MNARSFVLTAVAACVGWSIGEALFAPHPVRVPCEIPPSAVIANPEPEWLCTCERAKSEVVPLPKPKTFKEPDVLEVMR